MSRIEALLIDDTAGDPMTGLKWSRKSTRSVSKTLAAEGVAASPNTVAACPNTVAACLKRLNFSLQRNRKSIGETRHPQRDQQFRHLSAIKASFEDRGQPVISVDSKKRELVGLFLNPGQTWCWMGREVLTHDFRSQSFGVALPYGIYDPQRNAGTVIVGTSHDTAEFAVDAIEPWLTTYGWYHHPDMRELLILCDTGGSNSAQSHLWKYCLYQQLQQRRPTLCRSRSAIIRRGPPSGIPSTIASSVSSASTGPGCRWSPMRSSSTTCATTTTTTGLTVDATLNRKRYDTGKKISTELYRQIEIQHDAILPQWNYTIQPSHPTCLNAN